MIPSDMTVLLDESTPILKFILIQGGKLIFDDADDLHLQSEMILITSGGLLQVGDIFAYFSNKYNTLDFILMFLSVSCVKQSKLISSRLGQKINLIQRKLQLQCMVMLDPKSFPSTEQRALPSERGTWSFMVSANISLCNTFLHKVCFY